MINKNYREAALKTYGESCELCGHRTSLEVHHIDYLEHQVMENKIRLSIKQNATNQTEQLKQQARQLGYDEFFDGQLAKNDSTLNLSVLCGNCHSQCHLIDYGKNLLKALKSRR